MIGLGVSLPALVAFVAVQRSAVFRFVETLPARLLPRLRPAAGEGVRLHAAVAAIYGNRRHVRRAVAIHLAAWLAGAGEAGLALLLLGHALPVADVVAMESIIFAIRSAAFVVPGAVGIQEGGYILVGAALGLPPDVALAVSLLKRGRELLVGVPAVFAWHFGARR